MRLIDNAERRARLGRRQFLAASAAGVDAVAEAMVGLHSSDPATVYLSLAARLDGFVKADLDQALYDAKSVVRILGMRRTMFVLPRELAAIVNAACTRALAPPQQRRLAKLIEEQDIAKDGVAWVSRVSSETLAALEAKGEAMAADLRADVPELAIKVKYGQGEFGMSTRILFLLATEGRIIRGRPRGTWVSSLYRWAPMESWLGQALPDLDQDEARVQLIARWLRSFGPGTLTDIKWWTGWSQRDTKAALAGCDAVEVGVESGPAWMLADDVDPVKAPAPWAALLPGLDPTPMGWKERDWYLGGHDGALFDSNGNIGPTVWCDGRIVGGWAQGSDGSVSIKLLEPVSSNHKDKIEQRRRQLEDWLGEDRFTPRFRTPLEKLLSVD